MTHLCGKCVLFALLEKENKKLDSTLLDANSGIYFHFIK